MRALTIRYGNGWGEYVMDEQWTIKKRTTNVWNVQTANTQRIHSALVSTLPQAQNFEHVRNKKKIGTGVADDPWAHI